MPFQSHIAVSNLNGGKPKTEDACIANRAEGTRRSPFDPVLKPNALRTAAQALMDTRKLLERVEKYLHLYLNYKI